MWKRLDSDDIVESYLKEARQEEAKALSRLLEELATRAWASNIYAVTSLGNLRLTSADNWQAADRHGAIAIDHQAPDKIGLYFIPAGSRHSAHSQTCHIDDAAAKVELMLLRLFEDR